MPPKHTLLIADHTVEPLARYLGLASSKPEFQVDVAPFGTLAQQLANSDTLNSRLYDVALVWNRIETALPSFQQALDFRPVKLDDLLDELERFGDDLLKASALGKTLFVPTWTLPSHMRGYGVFDTREESGLSALLAQLNLALLKRLKKIPNAYALNLNQHVQSLGDLAHNPKLWYMGKLLYTLPLYKRVAEDIRTALSALSGKSKKMIIVDLDDTLWGGTIGDNGLNGLKLGGHDPVGEAHADFQLTLKSFTNRGIILGIVSKNEEKTAIHAIEYHPEMLLRLKDFVGWKINWRDKAQNISELVTEVGIGLDSVVFIDDNPLERGRVREALKDVLVPEWPNNPLLYKSALMQLSCFDKPTSTEEDLQRTQMYATENLRKQNKAQLASMDDWLASLNTQVLIEPLNAMNFQRILQLLNKTNQMNLQTRRFSDADLEALMQGGGSTLWSFRVSDRFGDSGLTGVLTLTRKDLLLSVDDFVLSCRVMGRQVEESMLHFAVSQARHLGTKTVQARFNPTEKNKPCLDLFLRSGFFEQEPHVFMWDCTQAYAKPQHVNLCGG